MTNFWLFLGIYAFIGGIFLGIAFMCPIYATWLHFPHKRGMVSGVLFAAQGVGVFAYNFFTFSVVKANTFGDELLSIQGNLSKIAE
jgi:hypothetical protein